jgi:hypothetical protein
MLLSYSLISQEIYDLDTLKNENFKRNANWASFSSTRFHDFILKQDSSFYNKIRLRQVQAEVRFTNNRPFGNTDGRFMQVAGFQSLLTFQFSYLSKKFGIIASPSLFHVSSNNLSNKLAWGGSIDFKSTRIVSEGITLYLNVRQFQIGFSNARFNLGPGFVEHLLIGNNAPGFKHIYFRSLRPLKVGIGELHFSLASGALLPTRAGMPYENIFGLKSYTPSANRINSLKRYYNSLNLTFKPKMLPNNYFGINRQFLMPLNSLSEEKNIIIRYLPVFQNILKSSIGGWSEDSVQRDQQLSIFYSLLFPSIKSQLNLEYGWNDHKWNLRDLFIGWPHSSAYIVSFKKIGSLRRLNTDLVVEYVRMRQHSIRILRDAGDWYSFHGTSVGPTHQGQILGVGGSNGLGADKLYVIYRVDSKNIVYGMKYVNIKNNHTYIRNRPYIWTDHVFGLSIILRRKYYQIRNEFIYINANNYGLALGSKSSFQVNVGVILKNAN